MCIDSMNTLGVDAGRSAGMVGFHPIVIGAEPVSNQGAKRRRGTRHAVMARSMIRLGRFAPICALRYDRPTMNTKKDAIADLAPRYRDALRVHLTGKQPGNLAPARILGRAAHAEALLPRDVVVVHERALTALLASVEFKRTDKRLLPRAGRFLAGALAPIEAALRATRENNRTLRERNVTLRQHSAELARGNRLLGREVARRQAGEAVISRGKEKYRVLFLESQVMQKKLRDLARQILSTQEEERKRISRELHDEVVQTLVGINVELAALGKSAEAGLRAFRSRIARTQRLVETSVSAVHRFARELRPAVLDDLGLIPALHAFSRTLATRNKLRIQITAFHGVENLSAVRRTVLFRVAQEALTNVVRHARATIITVGIVEVAGGIRMEITDDGRSFSVEKIFHARNPKRLGLLGMKERVEMVGGALSIVSAPGRGTTVRVDLPVRSGSKLAS